MNDMNIMVGDCREVLDALTEHSVQCVVTSPPYWGQRDYGTTKFIGGNDPECDHIAPVNRRAAGFNKRYHGKEFATDKQGETPGAYAGKCGKCGAVRSSAGIGLEADVTEWVDSIVQVFQKVRRVLRDDGTVWLNLGDKYAGSGGAGGDYNPGGLKNGVTGGPVASTRQSGLKQKDLIGLPWRVAFALQADGWYLRRDIIWHKPNPMPESATDRPSTAHEYIFLLTKQPHYFYDSDAVSEASIYAPGKTTNVEREKGYYGGKWSHPEQGNRHDGSFKAIRDRRTKRSVWTVPTQAFSGAHFATYPEKLVEPCIKGGTSERGECPACGAPWERVVHQERIRERTPSDNHAIGNFQSVSDVGNRKTAPVTTGWQPTCDHKLEPIPQTVLDPFSGAGTTGLVALKLDRSYIGIELNPEYAAMSHKRIVESVGVQTPESLAPDEHAQGRML